MSANRSKRVVGLNLLVLILFVLLLTSCLTIKEPVGGANIRNPVVAKISVGTVCGTPFWATLDGVNVTSQFLPLAPSGTLAQATFPGLASGAHTLTASAEVQRWFLFSYCGTASDTKTFNVNVDTPYMASCREQGVPIPPDWAETGTAWVNQGNLNTNGGGTNLLNGADDAFVWTYTDPNVRGACIALPRGSGAPGSLAGIICQGAATGKACFWDNQLKTAPNTILGWAGKKLEIAKLVDGTNFAAGGNVGGNCSSCHRGNNVFLISPDDPTWAKVLRGPLDGGPSGGKFTTQVDIGRYIALPVDPNFINAATPGVNCAGACHALPPPQVLNRRDIVNNTIPPFNRMPMPPNCGAACIGTP